MPAIKIQSWQAQWLFRISRLWRNNVWIFILLVIKIQSWQDLWRFSFRVDLILLTPALSHLLYSQRNILSLEQQIWDLLVYFIFNSAYLFIYWTFWATGGGSQGKYDGAGWFPVVNHFWRCFYILIIMMESWCLCIYFSILKKRK